MLEIKHTDKEKYSISGGNLEKRIRYAQSYGLELYFAISIKGIWMVFDSEYLQKNNGKIDISDMLYSKLDTILNCVSYNFPKDLEIKSVYSKTARKANGVIFETYGKLVSYELRYKGNRIFRVKGKNSDYIGWSMILEALQDRLSMDEQNIKNDGDFTIITEKFTKDFNMIPEYKFLLSPIEHMIDDNNEKYTSHTYLEKKKVKNDLPKFLPQHVRGLMQTLVNEGVKIGYIKNNLLYDIKPLKEN